MTLAETHELLEPAKVSKTRDALLSSRHLDGSFYTSPEVEALEKERIFMKEWLFMGRQEQLPNPGDYMATRIAGEPVVIVRDESGEINAYANVCRHRGVEVAPLGSGNATSFMCPYHAWTYGLDGKLISAPGMKDSSVDLSGCRLPVLHTEIWRGCIFATFNPDPEPLSDAISEFDNQLEFVHLEKCRLATKIVIDLKCNWKFAHENIFDFYHVSTIHYESFGKYYQKEPDYDSYTYWPNGGFGFNWEALPLTRDGKSLIGPMPWYGDQTTLAYYAHQFPNLVLAGRSDMAQLWAAWPVSPGHCQLIAHTLVAEEALAKPEFEAWRKEHEETTNEFIDEDRAMVESLQNGASSQMFQPGGMHKAEGLIHHYLNAYLDKMQGPAD